MYGLAQMPLNIKTTKSCLKCEILASHASSFWASDIENHGLWFMVYPTSVFRKARG